MDNLFSKVLDDNYQPLGDIYGCQCMGPMCVNCGICIHSHTNGSVVLPSAPLTYKKCRFLHYVQKQLYPNSEK